MNRWWSRHFLLILALAVASLALGTSVSRAQQAGAAIFGVLQGTETPRPSATPTALPTRTPAPTGTPFPGLGVTPTPGSVPILLLGFTVVIQPDRLLVTDVFPNSAASRAGLRVGDAITAVAGQVITPTTVGAALTRLSTTTTSVQITVLRASQTLTLLLVPGGGLPATPTPVPTFVPRGKLGVVYDLVTDQIAEDKGLKVNYGALVVEVQVNTPAAAAGIKVGDVITEVEGDKVDIKRNLTYRLQVYNLGDEVELTILRDGETIKLKVALATIRGIAYEPNVG